VRDSAALGLQQAWLLNEKIFVSHPVEKSRQKRACIVLAK
jgi:hypothetical protein